MQKVLFVLGMLASAIACTAEDVAEATAFAMSDAHVIQGEDLPENAKDSYELAFVRYDELGWTTQVKTPGAKNQPQNSDKAAAVQIGGPLIVWLPTNWDHVSMRTRARAAWHELTHINQQYDLGSDRMARLLTTKPYWRIATEIPASAQSLEVIARYGADEAEIHEFAEQAVDWYAKSMDLDDVDNVDEWNELVLWVLNERADDILRRRSMERD
jgi:hypothetical protein